MFDQLAAKVLFDMDGTLVDSTAVVESTWSDFAARHRLDARAVLAFAHGRPTADTVRRFLPDEARAAREIARIVAHEEVATDGIREIAGAGAVVSRLSPDQWAVVTSASRALALRRMRAAGIEAPRVLVAAEDVTAGKPDPQGYLMAARQLGAPIARCVVFEDSAPGVRAGIAGGACTIVVGHLDVFDHALPRITDFDAVTISTVEHGVLSISLREPAAAGRSDARTDLPH